MEKLFLEIILLLDSLTSTYFKTDRQLSEYAKISPSDISKIRNHPKYTSRFSEKELLEIKERFENMKRGFETNAAALTLEYFVFYRYSISRESITKHLLIVEYDENRKINNIRLIDVNKQKYIDDRRREVVREMDKYKLAIWEGNGVIHTASLFLNLAKKNVINGEIREEIQTIAQIVLYVGIAQSPAELVKGSYSVTSESGFPVAGLCILRRFGTKTVGMRELFQIPEIDNLQMGHLLNEIYKAEMESPFQESKEGKDINRQSLAVIDDVIALELRNKREITSVEGLYPDIAHFRSFALYKKLHESIAGYYEFYHFSSNEEYIGRASLCIKKDGMVLLTTKLRSYVGEIQMLDAGNFFRMDIFYGHSQQNHYDLIVSFERDKDTGQVYMVGFFSGFGDKPESGVIFLQKSTVTELDTPFEEFIMGTNKIFLFEEHHEECIELLKNEKLKTHLTNSISTGFVSKYAALLKE